MKALYLRCILANLLRSFTALALCLTMLPSAMAEDTLNRVSISSEPAGMIKKTSGTVSIERGGQRLKCTEGMPVHVGDKVHSGKDGLVGIALKDDTLLSAGPDSTLMINAFSFNPRTHDGKINARVDRGTVSVISGKISKQSPSAVKYSTPTTVFGVRGTEFLIQVAQAKN